MPVIRVKRGLEANRSSFTPVTGELVWTTDQKVLYIGDGSTVGGIPVHPATHAASTITQDSSHRFVSDEEKSTWNAKQQALTSLLDIVFKGATIYGDILPDTTQTRNIGSPDYKFKEAWIDTLHLAANTLYLDGTPVLGSSGASMNFSANIDQGITISTTGTGQTKVQSVNGAELSVSGLNADVKVQSTGDGGRVVMGAVASVNITAPTTAITGAASVSQGLTVGSLTCTGDAYFNGTNTIVNSTTVETVDNTILLNKGEVGNGVTSGQAGVRVDRGNLADALFVFDEVTDAWQAGLLGGTLYSVATELFVTNITDTKAPINNAALTGIPTAPTASNGTNTTQIATTAFVQDAISGLGSGNGHTIQDEGIDLTARTKLNFVGSGVTVSDDSGNNATVVTISSSSGGFDITPEAQLVQAVIPNTIGTIYTATSKRQIKEVFICNQSAGDVTFSIALVLSGDTLDTKNYLFRDVSLSQNESKQLSLNTIMPANSTLQMVTNGTVSVVVSGNNGSPTECDTNIAQSALASSMTTIFTASSKTILKEIVFCNQTSGTATVDVAVINSGDTLDTKNYILKNFPLVDKETKQASLNMIIPVNAVIQMKTTGTVAVTLSGVNGL